MPVACGKISNRFIDKYKTLIRSFSNCPVSEQEILIANADKSFARLICEIALNVLFNSLSLSDKCLKNIKKFKKQLLYFSDRKIALCAKVKTFKKNKKKHRIFVNLLFKCITNHI